MVDGPPLDSSVPSQGRGPITALLLCSPKSRGLSETLRSWCDSVGVDDRLYLLDRGLGPLPDLPSAFPNDPAIQLLSLGEESHSAEALLLAGLDRVQGDRVLLLSSGVLLTPSTLSYLSAALDTHPELAAVGPVSDSAPGPQNLAAQDVDLGGVSNLGELAALLGGCEASVREVEGLAPDCLLLRRDALRAATQEEGDTFFASRGYRLPQALRSVGGALGLVPQALVGSVPRDPSEGRIGLRTARQRAANHLWEETRRRLGDDPPDSLFAGNVLQPQTGLASIIVLVWDNWEVTKPCLASLYDGTTLRPFELILVDNGSGPETARFLDEMAAHYDNVVLVRNDKNQGYSYGCNQGLAAARGDYLVLLNNDVVLTPHWLSDQIALFVGHPQIGLVGPMTNETAGPQLVPSDDVHYESLAALSNFAADWRDGRPEHFTYTDPLTGLCMVLQRDVITKIGGLDTSFWLGNYEDNDFCIRVARAGYQMAIARDVFIHHEGSSTFKAHSIDYESLMARNWEFFCAKWGFERARGTGFPTQELVESRPFEPAFDYIPPNPADVCAPGMQPIEIQSEASHHIMMIPDLATDGWRRLLTDFLMTVGRHEDLGLLVRVEPATVEATRLVMEALTAQMVFLGMREEDAPEIILDTTVVHSGERGRLYAAADAMLDCGGSRANLYAREAAACGLPIIPDLGTRGLRLAIAELGIGGQPGQLVAGEFAEGELEATVGKPDSPFGPAVNEQPTPASVREPMAKDPIRPVASDVEELFGLVDSPATLSHPGSASGAEERASVVSIAESRRPLSSRPGVSIIIVTYNSADSIDNCLRSLKMHCGPQDEVVVVDNVSGDQTRTILRGWRDGDLPNIKLIFADNNLGFSRGVNAGLDQASCDLALMLNPDTVITGGALDAMARHLVDSPDVGAVGPTSDYAAGMQNVGRHYSGGPIDAEDLAATLRRDSKGPLETNLLIGFCLMMRRDELVAMGGMDPELFLGNDDLDMSLRLKAEGKRLLIATDAFVHHRGQVSFNTEPKQRTAYLVGQSTNLLYEKLYAMLDGDVPTGEDLWGVGWFSPQRERLSVVCVLGSEAATTAECLRSLLGGTHRDLELILVARTPASSAAAKSLVEPQEGVKHILAPEDMSPGEALNLGCVSATGTFVLLSSDDVIYPRGTVAKLLALLNTRKEWGLVGPRCAFAQGAQGLPPGTAELMESVEDFAWFWHEAEAGASKSVSVLGDFCLLGRRDFILSLGGVDPTFAPGTYRGMDLCMATVQVGREVGLAQDVVVHRLAPHLDAPEQDEAEMLRFAEKWGLGGGSSSAASAGAVPGPGSAQATGSSSRSRVTAQFDLDVGVRNRPQSSGPAPDDPFHPSAPPLGIQHDADVLLLCIPDWEASGWKQLLASFVAAFRPDERVGLLVRVEPPSQELTNVAVSLLQTELGALGVSEEDMPEIVLEVTPLAEELRPGLYTAARAYLSDGGRGDLVHRHEATACGLPVLDLPSPEALRELLTS